MENNSSNLDTIVDIKTNYVHGGLHDKSRGRSENGAIDAYLVMSKIGGL